MHCASVSAFGGQICSVDMKSETFDIEIVHHKDTGLLVALSDEFPGLYAHGRTSDEVLSNACEAVKAILEAKGR